MKNNILYEYIKLTQKAKEKVKGFINLLLFIILAAIASLLVMDLMVTPITIFAIKKSDLFTSIIKYSILVITMLLIVFAISRIIMRIIKKQNSFKQIQFSQKSDS